VGAADEQIGRLFAAVPWLSSGGRTHAGPIVLVPL
jgi:hypothetical protein